MEKERVEECRSRMTGQNMRDSGGRIRLMDMGFFIILTVIFMKDIGKTTNLTDVGYISVMKGHTKVIGKKICCMDLGSRHGKMEVSIVGVIIKALKKVTENIIGQTAIIIKAAGKTANFLGLAS